MVNRLLLSFPLYLSVSAQTFVRFIAVDKTPVVDYMATMKVYLPRAMQDMVAGALHSDAWDRLVVWEADMLPPADGLTRIAQYPDHLDIVGGLYFQHREPHHPMVFEQHDETHYKTLHYSQINPMVEAPGLYPVDAVGMGFTSIHRRVLEKWNPDIPMFHSADLGHDMYHCREAKKQGFSVHVDTGLPCQHISEEAVGYRHYLAQQSNEGE
jgi:hypothetical protein